MLSYADLTYKKEDGVEWQLLNHYTKINFSIDQKYELYHINKIQNTWNAIITSSFPYSIEGTALSTINLDDRYPNYLNRRTISHYDNDLFDNDSVNIPQCF
jgi:hypothetical protein